MESGITDFSVFHFADMGKKKVVLASKVQIKQAMLLQSTITLDRSSKAAVTGKGGKAVAEPLATRLPSLAAVPEAAENSESTDSSAQLISHKQRRTGKCL